MPRFKSTKFYQNKPNFVVLRAPPPDPLMAFGGWGRSSQRPKTVPTTLDFWLRAGYLTCAAHTSKG